MNLELLEMVLFNVEGVHADKLEVDVLLEKAGQNSRHISRGGRTEDLNAGHGVEGINQ